MDVLTKDQRSYCMSRIRAKNTKPEIALRKELWSIGLRYRIHYKLPGKPDIVFVGAKVAIFVDGCFWHGCPKHSKKAKTNTKFWNNKIEGNKERDKKNKLILEKDGWKVMRFWEHDIESSITDISKRILKTLKTK